MNLKRGQVVWSKAGRDQGSFLAVLECRSPWAVLADGGRRPLERPKRKRLIHLAPTARVLPEEALAGNRRLRAALRAAGGKEARPESGPESTKL